MSRRECLFAETKKRILSGQFGVSGTRMLSVREFAKAHACSLHCALDVYDLLLENYLLRRCGSKYYVVSGRCSAGSDYQLELDNCGRQVLGALISDSSNPFFASLLQILQDVLDKAGIDLVVSSSGGDLDRERHILDMFVDMKCRGVFICVPLRGPLKEMLRLYPLPSVVIAEECDLPSVAAVTVENFSAGEQVARHLYASGCRFFAYVTLDDYVNSDKRLQGYHHFLQSQGISLEDMPVVVLSSTDPERRKNEVKTFVRRLFKHKARNKLPIGIFCVHDLLAVDITRAIRIEEMKGTDDFRIPEDIKIVGFDNLPHSSLLSVPITTVAYPYSAMAEAALRQMTHLMQDPYYIPENITIGYSLIVRKSSC